MLERVPTCLEPITLLPLRRLEQPIRSRRNLDPLFWRNHGDTSTIAVAPWWPTYLAHLRAGSPPIRPRHEGTILNAGTHAPVRRHSLPSRRPKDQHVQTSARSTGSCSSRGFSKATCSRQQVPLKHEQKGGSGGGSEQETHDILSTKQKQAHAAETKHQKARGSSAKSQPHIGTSITTAQPSEDSDPASKALLLRLEALSKDVEPSPDYSQIWKFFNLLRNQQRQASRVLEVLFLSESEVDQERATKAFSLIPMKDRTEKDYEYFMQVCIKRHRFNLATRTLQEAMSNGVGVGSSQILLSFFVQHGLWRNAANLFPHIKFEDVQPEELSQPERDIWSILDTMTDLPARILDLTTRLRENDPLLLERRANLLIFANRLFWQMLSSSHILGQITLAGLLSIMDSFYGLGIIRRRHYHKALKKLHGMAPTRNRVELAIALYRNFRYRYGKTAISRWVFGSIISMCHNAGRPPQSYVFLLDDFREAAGKPDVPSYLGIMSACAYQGEKETLHEIFETFCNDYGKPQNIEQVKPLLYVYARLGDPMNALRTMNEFTSRYGFQLDTACWNMVLLAYTRSDEPDNAFSILTTMQKDGIKLDSYTFGTAMGLCANRGDVDAVLTLVDMARQAKVPGNTAMLDTLVEAYCRVDDVESAKNLAETAVDMRLSGSLTRAWNILLRYHAARADSEAVLATQTRMRELGVKPDGMTYAALMSALIMLGKTNDAAKILRSLHLSQNMQATQFHYAIVLRGYVEEGNRDMANIIYNEMRERFPRLGPSTRLSMLRLQLQRDQDERLQESEAAGEPLLYLDEGRAKNFLSDLLLDVSGSDSAVTQPQPGFGRRPLLESPITPYLESYLRILYATKSFVEADRLLRSYDTLTDSLSTKEGRNLPKSIDLWASQLQACAVQSRWSDADSAWEQTLIRAIELAGALKAVDLALSSRKPAKSSSRSGVDRDLLLGTSVQAHGSTLNSLGLSSSGTESDQRAWRRVLNEPDIIILPAQRYLLSLPLYRYLLILDAQEDHGEIITLVERLQGVGFALTSMNWNTYVQVLSKSKNPEHRILAFQVFEEKLLPQAPSWSSLLRGEALFKSDDGSVSEARKREVMQRLNPDVATPAYTTVVFLANALLRMNATPSGQLALSRIRQQAENTFQFVKSMPYRADRLQGVLLRGRSVKGDKLPRPRRPPQPNRAGVVGSTSPLDHVPVDLMGEIEAYFSSRTPAIRSRLLRIRPDAEDDPITQKDLEQAEKITGEVYRSPAELEGQRRTERPDELARRMQDETRAKEEVVRELRRDIHRQRLVADPQIGDPFVDAFQNIVEDEEPVSQTLSEADMKSDTQHIRPRSNFPETLAASHTNQSSRAGDSLRRKVARRKRRSAYLLSLRLKPILQRAELLPTADRLASLRMLHRRVPLRVKRRILRLLRLRRALSTIRRRLIEINRMEIELARLRKDLGNTGEGIKSAFSRMNTSLDRVLSDSGDKDIQARAQLLVAEVNRERTRLETMNDERRRIYRRGTKRRSHLRKNLIHNTEELDSVKRKLADIYVTNTRARRVMLVRNPRGYFRRIYDLRQPLRAAYDISFKVRPIDRLRMRLARLKQQASRAVRMSGAKNIGRRKRKWEKRKKFEGAQRIMKEEREVEQKRQVVLPSAEQVQEFLAENEDPGPKYVRNIDVEKEEDQADDVVDIVDDSMGSVFKPFGSVQDYGYNQPKQRKREDAKDTS